MKEKRQTWTVCTPYFLHDLSLLSRGVERSKSIHTHDEKKNNERNGPIDLTPAVGAAIHNT